MFDNQHRNSSIAMKGFYIIPYCFYSGSETRKVLTKFTSVSIPAKAQINGLKTIDLVGTPATFEA